MLNDNRPAPGFSNKWGWSLLIIDTTRRTRVLFDADSDSTVLAHNLRVLGLRPNGLTWGVLSHEHWDHYGGFPFIADANPGMTVYVPPGLHQWARHLLLRLVINDSGLQVDESFVLTPPIYSSVGGVWEHALAVDVGESTVVVTGCSHPGVDVLVEKTVEITGKRPLLVIGGFHGPRRRQLERLLTLSKYISPAHCSGEEAVNYIARRRQESLVPVRTGSIVKVEEGRVVLEKF